MARIANSSRSLGLYLGLFFGYFIVGHLLSNVSFQSQIMPIWLPAGIALVGCYLWWLRFLPAVFIASFAFNYSVHPALGFGNILGNHGLELILIAFGASLQALVGSSLLRFWLGSPLKLSSNKHILYFILLVGILVNLISANIGTMALSAFNPDYSKENYWMNLVYWWLGDSLGVLLVTPFLLSLINFNKMEEQQKKSRILILSFSGFMFLSVLVLTGFFISYSNDVAKKSTSREIKSIENGLYRELNNSMAQLQNLASFIQNTQTLDKSTFSKFVDELMLSQPTISAMSWNPVIAQGDKNKHETDLESIYGRKVPIRGESLLKLDPIVYVKFIFPEDENKKAIGFNVYSNQKRKTTLMAAEFSFQPRATPIIQLVQSESKAPAYLMFFPVFEKGRELRGYATGVFLAEGMLHRALGTDGRKNFDYQLYEKNKEQWFSSNNSGKLLRFDTGVESLQFQLAGQVWELYLRVNKEYYIQQQSQSYLFLFSLQFVIVTFIILLILMMNSRQIELRYLVAEKTESLKAAMQEANNANSAKSRFLANMSHEIRTPMNAVIGFSSLARHTDDKAVIQDYLEKIEVSSDLLLSIVNDILDISKVEADKLTLSEETFDINTSCKRINSLFQSQVEEKGLSWRFVNNIPASLYFNGDQVRFEQVLVNLCSNALKFTKHGEIAITFDIDVLSPVKNKITVRVKDTGIGINKENQKKLFNAFTQADNSTSREFGGTGLGLALSKELSRLMHGDITIESDEGRGSEFIFTSIMNTSEKPNFDFNSSYEIEANLSEGSLSKGSLSKGSLSKGSLSKGSLNATNKHEPSLKGQDLLIPKKAKGEIKDLNILVAEDNEINQLVISAILEKLGIKVNIVTNGEQAVQRVQQENFDVVLMDCQMPVLDGYKATEKIRELDGCKALPIFALTADVTAESKEKARLSGFSGHLSKPILIDDLLEKLEGV